MKHCIHQTTYLTLSISLLMLLASAAPTAIFSMLSLEHSLVAQGEVWRIITGNFVHFGWAHTLMNLAAFLLCSFALLNTFSLTRFVSLLFVCCFVVGLGVYFFNPEYETYAGLSGAIHGLIMAGLLLNKRHAYWVNGILIALLAAKIFHEHQLNYQTTELQKLLPVFVASDAHLYGALAGLLFGVSCLLYDITKHRLQN